MKKPRCLPATAHETIVAVTPLSSPYRNTWITLIVVIEIILMANIERPASASVERTLMVDGRSRRYLLHVPQDPCEPSPLVLVFHGGGGNVGKMTRLGFEPLAQRDGFVVAYPEGVGGHWNDGRQAESLQAQREDVNDVNFVRKVLDDICADQGIDRSRIFATGVSNGAIFCHRLAAEASDLVAAIAPVIGGMAEPIAERFQPAFPVSMLAIQGDADPLVPFGGGEIGLRPSGRRGRIIPTTEMTSKYLTLNGIVGEPNVVSLPDLDPQDGTTTEVTRYPPGPLGFLVRLYVVHGGGHQWPGHGRQAAAAFSGKASRDFDATEVIWEFFRSCPARGGWPVNPLDGPVPATSLPYDEAVPPGSELMAIVDLIASQGQRLPGWPASAWVEQFLAEELAALGATVTLQAVPETAYWVPGPASLRVIGCDSSFPVYPLMYNPGTAAEGVRAELVEYPGIPAGLGGKIVLLDFPLGQMSNQGKLAARSDWYYDPDETLGQSEQIQPTAHKSPAAPVLEALLRLTGPDAPAAVLAHLSNYWDNERYIGSWRSGRETFQESVPAGWIRRSTAASLRQRLAQGPVTVELKLPIRRSEVTTHNVFGLLPGCEPDRGLILVSTHHDAPFAGAVEDASGIAVVLGQARYWAAVPQSQRPFDLVFYFGSAHFDGRRGTHAFVTEYRGLLDHTVLNLAFEHSGREATVMDGVLVLLDRPQPRWLYVSEGLMPITCAAVITEDRRRVLANTPGRLSPPLGDGYDFWALGLPVVQHVSVPVYLFSEEDVTSFVEPDLDAWTRVYARIVWDFERLAPVR